MTSDLSYAHHVLKHLGFGVEPIAPGDGERADWVATIRSEVALVEEKTKFDDPDEVSRRKTAFGAGHPFSTQVPLKPNNRLSGITYKAASQLGTSAAEIAHDFRIIWLTATGFNHEAKFHQYIATLYGSSNVIENGRVPLKRCYFFRNSDFYRHRQQIDGAVVAEVAERDLNAKLCLNPLSPRYARFRDSAIREAFATAVMDPNVAEAAGDAYIVDCDIDRARENDILEYLKQKYSTGDLMSMDMGYASVAMAVKNGDG